MNSGLKWEAITSGFLRSLVVVLGGVLITIVFVARLSGPVYYLSPWVSMFLAIAAITGGYQAAKAAGCRGWLHGLIVGCILGIAGTAFWSYSGPYSFLSGLLDVVSTAGWAGFGGMLGVYRDEEDQRRSQEEI